MVTKGWGRINWEIGIDTYTLLLLLCDIHTLLSIKLTTNKDLMYSTRNSIQYSVMAYKEKNLEKSTYMYMWGIPGGASCKEPACQCRRRKRCRFNPWDTKIPRRRAWQPTPVFLPRESHGQRSLMGYSPNGHKQPDTIEVTQHSHTHICIRVHSAVHMKVTQC